MPRRRIEGVPIKRPSGEDIWRKVSEPGPGATYRGYVRFSHEAGHYGLTTQGQKAHMQAYADARGWVCLGWDEEPAKTAKYEDIDKRPVFKAHLEAAEAGAFDVSLSYMADRWARNKVVAFVSLSRLRRAAVWWATTDGKWTIDRTEEDGWDVAFAVEVTINAAYSRRVSEKTRIGMQTRAEMGLHLGDVTFGYQRPADDPRPDGAPYSWRSPRKPLVPHPTNFARLVQVGEWAAAGLSDQRIADLANAQGWRTQTTKGKGPKYRYAGEDESGVVALAHDPQAGKPRLFSKDAIRSLVLNRFPREFAPGIGLGTIFAPDGKRLAGKHPSAWSWELCQRIDEQRALRHGGRLGGSQRRVWLFSGIVVCAACGNRLSAQGIARSPHADCYRDTAHKRGLACSADGAGWHSVKASVLEQQFVRLVLEQSLPDDWREQIAAEYTQLATETDWVSVDEQRARLDKELQRAKFQHQHGLLDDDDLLATAARIQQQIDGLPTSDEGETSQTIAAGETLATLRDYWHAASSEAQAELVKMLLTPEGIVYDLQAGVIEALRPRRAFLAIIKLSLPEWEERDGALWAPHTKTPVA